MIDASTKAYAILGNPVRHSLSPLLHNTMFQKYHIDAVYVAFQSTNLKLAIQGAKALGIEGLNITLPFKTDVMPYIDKIDDSARKIGSVNTIKNDGDKLTGFNTDYLGFLESIKDIDLTNRKICIIGAGGAANSIVYALSMSGVRQISLYNRTYGRAYRLKKHFEEFIDIQLIEENSIHKYDAIINCTSLGLKETDTSPINLKLLDKNSILIDIIYNSRLIEQAKKMGFLAISGEVMFVYQAYFAFEIWTGIKFDVHYAFEVINGSNKYTTIGNSFTV